MNFLKKLWDIVSSDRYWVIACMLFVMGLLIIIRVNSPLPIGAPAWWPYYLAFAAAFASAVGLLLRKEWSRYTSVLIGAMFAFVIARKCYYQGFTPMNVTNAIISVATVYYFWRVPITHLQELLADPGFVEAWRQKIEELQQEFKNHPSPRIVLLLSEPLPLDASQLAVAAQRAYGHAFEIIPGCPSPTAAGFLPNEHPEPFVTGEPPTLLCFSSPWYFLVSVAPESYPFAYVPRDHMHGQSSEPSSGSLPDDQSDDDAWVPAFGHRAAIEIELLPTFQQQAKDSNYAHTSKLVTELLDDRCLGLYFVNADKLLPNSPPLIAALRSDNPAEALQLVDETAA